VIQQGTSDEDLLRSVYGSGGDEALLAEVYGQKAAPSAGTIAKSAVSSIGGGAIGTLGAGLEGLGLLADKIEQYLPESWQRPGSPFRETGVAMQEYGASLGAEARQQVQSAGGATKFLGSTVPEALGSSAAFGATALATGGLGGAAMGTGAIAITGAAAGASQGYNDAKAHGASEEDAWTSAAINAGAGAFEAAPIGKIVGRLLKRMPRSVGKIVVDALKEGGEEMAQETGQQIVGNLTAKYWAGYEEDRDILKGVAEQGGAGALTGFLMSLVGGSAGTLMQRRAQAQEQAQAGLAKAGPAEPGAQKQAFDPLAHTIPPMAQGEQGTPQEAAGAPESAPAGAGLAMLESRVNRQAEEMEAATGQPQPRTTVRPVAPATTEEQDDTDFASDYGVKLTLVEGDKGPLQFPGMHTTGEVFVDRNLPSPLRRRMVLVHELVHELGAVDRPALDALVADFTKVDPEGMANAQAATAKDWEAATGDTYGPGVLEEETIARRVETLGRWLDEGLRNPERFSQALLADKTVFERFRDAVSRLLQRVGLKGLKSSQQVRIEKLIEELGQPATGDARKAIALVQKVEQALNILRGRDVAARTENPAQQRAQPDVGPEKTNSEATPSKAALEQDLTDEAAKSRPAGRETDVELGSGTALPARYVAVEAEDLIPSHDARSGFRRNEKGDANERDYSDPTEGRPYRDRVEEIAMRPKPLRVTSDTPSAIEGPPVTTEDLVVLGGNARTMGMQLAYHRGGASADAYRKAAIAAAEKLGIDSAAVGAMRNPVIVRVVPKTHSGIRGELSRELNESPSTRKTSTTEAVSRGSKIDERAARVVARVVGDGTLAEALGSPASANEILSALAEAGAIKPDEVVAITDANGKLTASGKDTIEQALLGAVVPSIRSIAEMAPATKQKLIRALPSLVRIKSAWPDFAKILTGSVDALTDLRRSGLNTVEELTRQASIVPEEWKSDPEAVLLAEALHAEKPLAFSGKMATLADEIADAASGQGGLFAVEKRTPKSAFKEQFGGNEDQAQAQAKRDAATSSEGSGREVPRGNAKGAQGEVGGRALFAVSPQGPSNVTVPEHTKTDRLSASFGQYLRRVETLRSAFGVSTDLVNWFERMPGRTKHLLKEWEKRNLKPVKDLLKQYDIEAWEAGRYLLALHVPDANALAAKRHPRKYGKASNPGSGMTNAEAAKIVTEYESDPKRAAGFKSIAGINRRMGEEKLKGMVAAGLVPQDVADQWRADLGPNYVSLANLDYDPDSRSFIPSSRSGVKGKESRSRQGRMSRADFSNIIPMTWSAAAEKIVRAEHNAVAQQVGEFVKEMKRDDIAEIVVNAQGVATKPNTKEGEEVFSYKEKGHDVHIVIRDKALADALKRMKMEFGGPILKALSHAMALWRGMRTTYNPEWFLSNLPSDLGDAIITIQREGKKSLGRKILKNIKPAVQAAWHAEHDTGTKTAYSAILQEAEENGALIGLIDLKGPQRIKAEFGSKAQDMTRPVKDAFAWLEATSSTFEKGVRLSIYKTMRDAGLTPFDAARVARETTTPFVRKGNYSPMMGLLYAFFNAKVQGMLIVKSALKSKQARNVLFAAIAIDFTIAAMNRALMGDDDEGRDRYDKVRKDKKTNQVFFGVPGSEMGFGWRAPRSYLWAHQFAVGLEALLFGNDYDAGEFGKDMLVSVVDAAVPFDTSGSLWQAMAPTAVDPGVQLLENKDFAGNAINPHDFPEDRRPDSEKAFKNASPSAKALAEFVNLVTGGDEVKPGLVSVKPGTVEHWVSFMLGGIGDTASRLIDLPEKIASGAISANDIPLARKLVTTADPRYEQREFYEGVTKVLNVVNLVGDYVKAGKLDEAKAIREEYPVEWSLRFRADIARKNVVKWRDQMEQADDARREKIQERIDGIMREFNVKADEARKKHTP